MSSILGVGIATIDVIQTVADYPAENDEVRALGRIYRRGGNVTNTLVVLSQLGHKCQWCGSLSDEKTTDLIVHDLDRYHITHQACPVFPGGSQPTSMVLLNSKNGSRTIVHYRDLPELDCAAFQRVPLEGLDWIHFEGRHVPELEKMLRYLRNSGFAGTVSLEVEKPRPGIEKLFSLADLLLFSRHYASSRGFSDARTLLAAVRRNKVERDMVCAWGESGAWGLSASGQSLHAPAYPPTRVIDTLGAGDVFNAGMIDGLLQGMDLAKAMDLACRLAGKKCGQSGLEIGSEGVSS